VERGGEASVFRRVCFRRNKLGAVRKDWEVSELFRVREITEHRVIASSEFPRAAVNAFINCIRDRMNLLFSS
jgi:hypothetical protein